MKNDLSKSNQPSPRNIDIKNLSEEERQILFRCSNTELIKELIHSPVITGINKTDLSDDEAKEAKERTKDFMSAILTGNGLETMIAAQMTAVHNLQIHAATYAKLFPSVDQTKTYVNMTAKLSNTFIHQAQFLAKLQGKGQQKVTVEHVNVHEGGQAIVGNITNNQGAENNE